MTEITKASRVSLALAGAVCTSILVGAMWIQGRMGEVTGVCKDIQFEQTRIVDRLDAMSAAHWTVQEMENWTLRLKLGNDSLVVPNTTGAGEVR
tara:strand:- start:2755 stop:3036 length:282 start_codon:yes stop_codon:yes gene_type:complete